jgi:hypothetical protein
MQHVPFAGDVIHLTVHVGVTSLPYHTSHHTVTSSMRPCRSSSSYPCSMRRHAVTSSLRGAAASCGLVTSCSSRWGLAGLLHSDSTGRTLIVQSGSTGRAFVVHSDSTGCDLTVHSACTEHAEVAHPLKVCYQVLHISCALKYSNTIACIVPEYTASTGECFSFWVTAVYFFEQGDDFMECSTKEVMQVPRTLIETRWMM